MRSKVVNIKHEDYDVYIGRGSKWGNPYVEGRDGTREEVIERYRRRMERRKDLIEDLDELRGMRLGCFCKPLPCHGDILIEMMERREDNEDQ